MALGAEFAAAARPFLIAQANGELDKMCELWTAQMKTTAVLTGSRNVDELKRAPVVVYDWLTEWVE